MRWHHLAPYLSVTSYLRFTTAPLPEAKEVAEAEDLAKFFEPTEPHAWIEDLVGRTEGLTRTRRAFSIHVGGATSVGARLLERAGPMDVDMVLGQDTEMGYRLAQAGAVFIPDPQARAYHLGPSMRMRDAESISRISYPLVADRVPTYRWLRKRPGRQWQVPLLEVVIDATGAPGDDVVASVDAILAGTLTDLAVLLVGPWDEIEPEQRAPLTDPHLDLALLRAHYGREPRVRLVGEPAASAAPFRLRLPPGWAPGEDSLAQLLDVVEEQGLGLLSVLLAEGPDGITAARLERTAAFARADLLVSPDEDVDFVVDETFGTLWVDGESYGFTTAAEAGPFLTARGAYRARVAAQAEVERLTKEVERIRGQVAKWRDEARRWRGTAVEYRREIGGLRRQIKTLRRAQSHRGLRRLTGLRGLRHIKGLARGLARQLNDAARPSRGGTG